MKTVFVVHQHDYYGPPQPGSDYWGWALEIDPQGGGWDKPIDKTQTPLGVYAVPADCLDERFEFLVDAAKGGLLKTVFLRPARKT